MVHLNNVEWVAVYKTCAKYTAIYLYVSVAMKTETFINADIFTTQKIRITGGKMNQNQLSTMPQSESGYMPYFYQSGLFLSYNLPGDRHPVSAYSNLSSGYDFTSDLIGQRKIYPAFDTVEDIIRRGYLAVPESDPETAIISDKGLTAKLGLDDVIGQIRNRHSIYQENIFALELAKCAAVNAKYAHEAYHGPTDSRVEYSTNKRLDELYSEQRLERVTLWRDVSRLRLQLPETAQNYLTSYRKISILADQEGDKL